MRIPHATGFTDCFRIEDRFVVVQRAVVIPVSADSEPDGFATRAISGEIGKKVSRKSGYTTAEIYRVTRAETAERTTIELLLEALPEPREFRYEYDDEEIERYGGLVPGEPSWMARPLRPKLGAI